MTELVEVLVFPLGGGVHDFMMDVLTIYDQIVLDVEDEVPRIGEGFGHLA